MANVVENRLKFTTEGLSAFNSGGKEVEALTAKTDKLRAGAAAANTQLNLVKTTLLGFAGLQGAGSLVTLSDEFKTLNSRLLVSSDNAGQAAGKYRELFAVAQQTRQPFSELVTLHTRLSSATEGTNISQERLLNMTRTVSQAMTVGGGTAESMQASLVQLGQAMASGTLRGEELNSIMEQAPRLAKALADGLGVSIGELRKLGAAGQLTSQDVLRALENSAGKVASEFAKMTPTIAQSATKLRNAVMDSLGALDRDLGKSDGLAKFLGDMADGLTRATPQLREFLKEAKPLIDFAATLAAIAAAGGAAKLLMGGAARLGGAAAALNPVTALPAIGAAMIASTPQPSSAFGSSQMRREDIERQIKQLQDSGQGYLPAAQFLRRELAGLQQSALGAPLGNAGRGTVNPDAAGDRPDPRYFSTNQALADLGAPTRSGIEKKYNESLTGFLKKANEDLVKAVDAGDKQAEGDIRAKITQGVQALQRERNDALFGLSRPSSAANEAFKKQVDALEHSYKLSEIALKGQVDVIDSRLKRGDMGELQAAQARFAAQSQGLDERDTTLTGQRNAATKGGFGVEAQRYDLELKDNAEKRKALALRLAEELQAIEERNVGDLLGLEAKNFQERGQLVEAFIADYQKTYGPALRKALLDGNEGLTTGYLAVYGSGLKQAQEGEQKNKFDLAQARFGARRNELAGSLQSARADLVATGDGAAYEQRLSAAYSVLLPQLRDAQAEMRALAGDNEKLVASTEQAGKDIGELQVKSLRSFGDGMREANAEYFGAISNMAQQGKRVMQDWNRTAENAFVEFAQTGKVNVKSLTDFLIAEMARAAYQKTLAKPLADIGKSLMSVIFGDKEEGGGDSKGNNPSAYVGGGGGGLGSVIDFGMKLFGFNHGGGIAGAEASFARALSPGVFQGAPRFHTGGLAGDEVPIIAQRGEGVFTRGQMAALAPVGSAGAAPVVNVYVQPAAGQTATVTQSQGANGLDIHVMLVQIEDGLADRVSAGQGKLGRSVGSYYGIRPQVA